MEGRGMTMTEMKLRSRAEEVGGERESRNNIYKNGEVRRGGGCIRHSLENGGDGGREGRGVDGISTRMGKIREEAKHYHQYLSQGDYKNGDEKRRRYVKSTCISSRRWFQERGCEAEGDASEECTFDFWMMPTS